MVRPLYTTYSPGSTPSGRQSNPHAMVKKKNTSSLAEYQILGASSLVTLFAGLRRFFGVVKSSLWTVMFVREKLILLKDIYGPCT
jgi:hypothetical protein